MKEENSKLSLLIRSTYSIIFSHHLNVKLLDGHVDALMKENRTSGLVSASTVFFRLISRLLHEPVDVLVAEMHAVRGRRKRKMLHGVDERNSEII